MTDLISTFVVILLLVYFVPSIIASIRHHRQRMAIYALNTLLGWTLLGWVGSFVWACTRDVEPRRRVSRESDTYLDAAVRRSRQDLQDYPD
jgi:sorbitol-specific phosphotransferase system component IIC